MKTPAAETPLRRRPDEATVKWRIQIVLPPEKRSTRTIRQFNEIERNPVRIKIDSGRCILLPHIPAKAAQVQVNGESLTQPRRLQAGDQILIGKFLFRIIKEEPSFNFDPDVDP